MNSKILHVFIPTIVVMLCALPAQAQSSGAGSRQEATAQKAAKGKVRIAGRVIDASLDGVGGAMVKVKSGNKIEAYALTNEDGAYELSVPEALMTNATVEISSMGFATLTLPLAELAKQPDVVLTREVSQLDEFTVKGKDTKVKHPDWLTNAVIYETNLRQASEDRNLLGLAKRLPELKRLGVDVICLMPIHPISEKNRQGTLGSPYAVADYKAVNPEFGTLDEFKDFVKLAHYHKMKVLLDEPCAYSGMDHPWVAEHPEYYARTDSGAMVVAPGRPDAYKFDYANPEWRRAMVDALEYWVKETGIDGYRFAEADKVPLDFWLRARKTVQNIKPVLFIAEASDPELLKEAFDADYGWPLTDTFTALAATQGVNAYAYTHNLPLPETNAQSIPEIIKAQRNSYQKGAVHLNMTSNHDLNAREGTEYDRYGDAARAFAVLTYLLPGTPMIYSGQEVGHGDPSKPFAQDTVPDFEPGTVADIYFELYTKLGKLRRLHPALWTQPGKKDSFKEIATTSPHTLVFEREADHDGVLVVVNLSSEPQDLNFQTSEPDVNGLENYLFPFVKQIPARLQPWEYHIFSVPKTDELQEIELEEIDWNRFWRGDNTQIRRWFYDYKKNIKIREENENRKQAEKLYKMERQKKRNRKEKSIKENLTRKN